MLQAALPGLEARDHCTWASFPLSPAIWAQGEGALQGGGLQRYCPGNACLAFFVRLALPLGSWGILRGCRDAFPHSTDSCCLLSSLIVRSGRGETASSQGVPVQQGRKKNGLIEG